MATKTHKFTQVKYKQTTFDMVIISFKLLEYIYLF